MTLAWLEERLGWAVDSSAPRWHAVVFAIASHRTSDDKSDMTSWFFLGILRALMRYHDPGTLRQDALADDKVSSALKNAEQLGFEGAAKWLSSLREEEQPTEADCEELRHEFLEWLKVASLTGKHFYSRSIAALLLAGFYWEVRKSDEALDGNMKGEG